MSLVCESGSGGRHAVVFSENTAAMDAHKALFRFRDDAYSIVGDNLFNELKRTGDESTLKVHITGGWEFILRLALSSEAGPSRGEVLFLLQSVGLSRDDLKPFDTSDINDIFHYLYYGKRLDVLKRLCRKARKTAEDKFNSNGPVRFDCHLVEPDSAEIVASTL